MITGKIFVKWVTFLETLKLKKINLKYNLSNNLFCYPKLTFFYYFFGLFSHILLSLLTNYGGRQFYLAAPPLFGGLSIGIKESNQINIKQNYFSKIFKLLCVRWVIKSVYTEKTYFTKVRSLDRIFNLTHCSCFFIMLLWIRFVSPLT